MVAFCYWTIVVSYDARYASHPMMPREPHGPFSTLTRGAFASNAEAVEWAARNLPADCKVRFRPIHS